MKRQWGALALCALGACRPSFDEDPAIVTAARVLAVKSEPAEAKPGVALTLTAFVATPPAQPSPPGPTWSFCTAPKPLTENDVVSSACLGDSSLVRVGVGESITAAVPVDACSIFGPNTRAGGYRPLDPDDTGGYFQPLRLDLTDADPTFHLERVQCGLADASADTAMQFGLSYVPNENPLLLPLVASLAGQAVVLTEIPRGARLELEVAWPAADAESYAYFDRSTESVTTRREAMSVAWYASGGALETEATGRAEDDLASTSSNVWIAPRNAGTERVWLVLRDSRGGVDFAAYDVVVLP